ncbi:MAG: helix-turn-helix transcriptional regulator [Lentisphaerae bacterium]|jgi:transcriptional regulator with XRE-family HTH domain|nr:helix-turn-helix transcriptional regulator [Lentisphaerota bacterium]
MDYPLSLQITSPRDFTKVLGETVRAMRQRESWTQPELSSRSGVPVSTLSRLERTGHGSADTLARLLFALGALDAFHDFLKERKRLAMLPKSLEDFEPRAKPQQRIRRKGRAT